MTPAQVFVIYKKMAKRAIPFMVVVTVVGNSITSPVWAIFVAAMIGTIAVNLSNLYTLGLESEDR